MISDEATTGWLLPAPTDDEGEVGEEDKSLKYPYEELDIDHDPGPRERFEEIMAENTLTLDNTIFAMVTEILPDVYDITVKETNGRRNRVYLIDAMYRH